MCTFRPRGVTETLKKLMVKRTDEVREFANEEEAQSRTTIRQHRV